MSTSRTSPSKICASRRIGRRSTSTRCTCRRPRGPSSGARRIVAHVVVRHGRPRRQRQDSDQSPGPDDHLFPRRPGLRSTKDEGQSDEGRIAPRSDFRLRHSVLLYVDPATRYSIVKGAAVMSFEVIKPFLRPIAHLIEDPTVTEIMVNGSGRIFVERKGRLEAETGVCVREQNLRVAVGRADHR